MDPGQWVPDPVRLSVHRVDPAAAVDHAADPVGRHFGPSGYIRAELWKEVRSLCLHSICVNLKFRREL